MSDRLAKIVVGVVIVVWVLTTVVLPLTIPGYKAPPEVSTIMGSLAGAAAAALFARRGGSNDPEKGKSKTEVEDVSKKRRPKLPRLPR